MTMVRVVVGAVIKNGRQMKTGKYPQVKKTRAVIMVATPEVWFPAVQTPRQAVTRW